MKEVGRRTPTILNLARTGKDDAISPSAKRGFMLFDTKARCSACHAGWSFTDGSFHDIGVASPDLGRGKLLQGVERMQHGSLATLEAVVDDYNSKFVKRPSLSHEIQPLGLDRRS
jgi:cytochrome c peroxidase